VLHVTLFRRQLFDGVQQSMTAILREVRIVAAEIHPRGSPPGHVPGSIEYAVNQLGGKT
jgi:hypothetical protein